MNNNDEVDLSKELAKQVREQLEILQPLSEKCSIYRAPKRERKLNETVYTPQVVSIGPLHHGKEDLKAMEELKRRYLLYFLQWSDASLEDIIVCIQKNERRLRNCYAESIELVSRKFIDIILVDSAFIICLLLKKYFPHVISSNDRIFNKPQMIFEVRCDLILMENQLPFFILVELFQLSNIVGNLKAKNISMINLTHHFFKGRWGSWVTQNILQQQDFSRVEHFVDFLRICQQPPNPKPLTVEIRNLAVPSLTELHRTGIKFELHSSEKKMDMEFDKHTRILKVPNFKFEKQVEVLLRNIHTFENCHCHKSNKYVNDYIFMLSLLIKSDKDVEILAPTGIIEKWRENNQAVATLFGNPINRDMFYFAEILENLNEHCKSTWHKWNANLKEKYFYTPWAGISVAAAAFLLALTVIQTVCSMLQV